MTERVVIGTLGDLAAVPGVPSEPTLRKLIRENPDFPVVSTGTNGHAYEIDIGQAIAWLKSHEEKRREAERQRSDEVRQFALELLGPGAAASVEQSGLSPADRKILYEEELAAIKLGERRGEFIRKVSIEAAIANWIVKDAQRRGSFAARLAKRIDLSRDQIAAIEALSRADAAALADDLEKLTETQDADAEGAADPAI